MNVWRLNALLLSLLIMVAPVRAGAGPDETHWHISGDLSEACSCSVPCSCNFGESPSPHAFCYALFSLDIQKGGCGDVTLDGLRLAGANGPKGNVFYIDERATGEQAEALKKIAHQVWEKALKANGIKPGQKVPPEFRFLGYRRAKIDQVVADTRSYLKIGQSGSFAADYIMGMDGKTPVVVENNWSWNIQHGIKAKTKRLAYHDVFGNRYEFKATNANQGRFDWDDSTPVYFR